jgi:hypothetical protein
MKPILEVTAEDKKLQSTLTTLFEDLYNRALPSDFSSMIRAGELDRPHIDSTSTGIELNYAYIYAHCYAITNAAIYCWAVRKTGTVRWSEYFSSSNEVKILNLYPDTEYEIKVKAYGLYLISSEWSTLVIVLTTSLIPSKVVGVTVADEALYVDPTTGVTLASVKIEWTDNALSELVDAYELIWYPT